MLPRPSSWSGLLVGTVLAASCSGADDLAENVPDGQPTVAVVESALGPVLADAEGQTLYLFTEDPPDQSTCTQYCVETWPPLVVDESPVAGSGVDAGLLDVVDRDDGSRQVTYSGQPLYYFAGADETTATDGHGLNDVWFAVRPSGKPVPADGSG